MAISVGDILRISAEMELSTVDQVINVFNFKVITNNLATDQLFMTELATLIDATYLQINGEVVASIKYVSIEGQNLTKNELLPGVPWSTLTFGANANTPLPTQITACVFFRTLTPKVRAAKFLPLMSEGANVNVGEVDGIAQAACQAFGDALVAGLVGANIEVQYGAFNVPLVRFTPVIQAIVPVRWRTQRRRRVGVGS